MAAARPPFLKKVRVNGDIRRTTFRLLLADTKRDFEAAVA
jgi:hypothetical protein